MLDPWEEYHNLFEEPLRKVFKLLDDKKFDEVDTYIDSVNFFRDGVEGYKREAKEEWKKILTQHQLTSTWICNEREKELLPQLPLGRQQRYPLPELEEFTHLFIQLGWEPVVHK